MDWFVGLQLVSLEELKLWFVFLCLFWISLCGERKQLRCFKGGFWGNQAAVDLFRVCGKSQLYLFGKYLKMRFFWHLVTFGEINPGYERSFRLQDTA